MSLNYSHRLVPNSPTHRPSPGDIAVFFRELIDNHNIAQPCQIGFSRVSRNQSAGRKIRNMVTGEEIVIPTPSRKINRPEILSDAAQIIAKVPAQEEYDIAISAEGIALSPPCIVGYVENDEWKPISDPYYLEVRCCVRNNVVRLYLLESEDDLNSPPDFASYRPRFGEDCSPNERRGLFVHPESGPTWIENAGCGTFWIEFKYGKFIFPRLRNGTVNVLSDSIVELAQKSFGCEFVQACDWG
jgi:hypothetical protein